MKFGEFMHERTLLVHHDVHLLQAHVLPHGIVWSITTGHTKQWCIVTTHTAALNAHDTDTENMRMHTRTNRTASIYSTVHYTYNKHVNKKHIQCAHTHNTRKKPCWLVLQSNTRIKYNECARVTCVGTGAQCTRLRNVSVCADTWVSCVCMYVSAVTYVSVCVSEPGCVKVSVCVCVRVHLCVSFLRVFLCITVGLSLGCVSACIYVYCTSASASLY